MTDEYTPTTEEIREQVLWQFDGEAEKRAGAAFDRWLAAHDREVRAKALEDFADRALAASEHIGGMNTIAAFAAAEAERIREGK